MAEARAMTQGDIHGTTISMNSELILKTTVSGKLEMVLEERTERAALSVIDLHRKLAHLLPSVFTTLSKHGTSLPLLPKNDPTFDCSPCTKAKMVRTIPKSPTLKASTPYKLVHSDVCGPFSTKTLTGSQYFISLLDDCSHAAHLKF